MTAPLFSIVVPTHDRPTLLSQALKSVLQQTVQDWECIVADDAGTRAVDVPIDARIRVVRLPVNQGAAAARKVGVDAALGSWVVFLDDDDELEPDRLELIASDLRGDIIVLSVGRQLNGNVYGSIADGFTPHLGTVAVRRDVFVRFDATYRTCEDVDWWLRIARNASVATIAGNGYVVTRHDGARHLSGDAARLRDSRRLLVDHADYFATHRRARAFRELRIAVYAKRLRLKREAARALVSSFRTRPSLQALRQLVGIVATALTTQSARTR